jgi:hypothetical protein
MWRFFLSPIGFILLLLSLLLHNFRPSTILHSPVFSYLFYLFMYLFLFLWNSVSIFDQSSHISRFIYLLIFISLKFCSYLLPVISYFLFIYYFYFFGTLFLSSTNILIFLVLFIYFYFFGTLFLSSTSLLIFRVLFIYYFYFFGSLFLSSTSILIFLVFLCFF